MVEVYQQAVTHLEVYVGETQNYYQKIEDERIHMPNKIYEDTLSKSIPQFFRNYDYHFAAHLIEADIDYQLLHVFHGDYENKGVAYIRYYFIEDKIQIMNQQVTAFEDFIDLLKADTFWEQEYHVLFQDMVPETISILISHGLREYLLDQDKPVFHLIQSHPRFEYAWEKQLTLWLSNLSQEQLIQIEQMVKRHLVTEII